MRKMIIVLLCLVLGGCGGDIVYHKVVMPEFDIISYTEVTDEQKKIAEEMLVVSKEFLGQEKLKKKFTIKIVYNRISFEEESSASKNMEYSVTAFYNYGKRKIVLPYYNFKNGTVAHEMVHAIIHVNRLKTSDGHSLAYQLSDKLDNENALTITIDRVSNSTLSEGKK